MKYVETTPPRLSHMHLIPFTCMQRLHKCSFLIYNIRLHPLYVTSINEASHFCCERLVFPRLHYVNDISVGVMLNVTTFVERSISMRFTLFRAMFSITLNSLCKLNYFNLFAGFYYLSYIWQWCFCCYFRLCFCRWLFS